MNSPLAKRWCKLDLPLQVLQSRAGFYIGTEDNQGPVSRDSAEYWETREAAQQALDDNAFTQREYP
jgi:hypothetical protein